MYLTFNGDTSQMAPPPADLYACNSAIVSSTESVLKLALTPYLMINTGVK